MKKFLLSLATAFSFVLFLGSCYFHLLGCCVLYALCIGFHALQFLKHNFYRKLRVYFGGGVLSLSGAVLSLLIGVVLRLWV